MTPPQNSSLVCQKEAFSLPDEVVYLNAARFSPLSKRVEAAGTAGLLLKRNPNDVGMNHFFDHVQQLREQFSQLVGNPEPDRVVTVPSVSYGMGVVAANLHLQPGDEIVVLYEQFPSNVYPWLSLAKESRAKVVMVKPPDTENRKGEKWNECLLQAITPRTRLVALPQVHWADGTLFNLQAVRARTREVDALMVVDGTQSIGALPFNLAEVQPDALVISGYKWLLGPYGFGLAYYGPALDGGKPLEQAWINRLNSEDFTGLVNYQEAYQPGALRYEAGGRSNFIAVPMLQEAIRQIEGWGVASIQGYCQHITRSAILQMQEAGFKIEDEDARAAHLFGVRFPEGYPLEKLKEQLKQRQIFVSFRGDAMRVSPYVYNIAEDLQQLADCMKGLR